MAIRKLHIIVSSAQEFIAGEVASAVRESLKDVDIKKIKDLIKNDPFIKHHKQWQKALQQMIKMKVRCEQQAFSAHSLNYVMEKYLPDKIKNHKTWLP